MKVQPLTSNSFCAKNTYLQKSKHSATKLERDYFKSLHKEAMARKSYLDYRKAECELDNFEEGINSGKDVWSAIKILAKMAKKKLDSVTYLSDAHGAFPNRFIEADNTHIYPHRHYQLKGNSLPEKIKTCVW